MYLYIYVTSNLYFKESSKNTNTLKKSYSNKIINKPQMKKIIINGNDCKTKEKLFDTFSNQLNFEDYFSNNWDSFEELINDLETETQIIFILKYNLVLENENENLEIFEKIIKESNKTNKYQFLKAVKF